MREFGAGTFRLWMGLPHWSLLILPLLLVWTLFWKGLALWHSAQRKDAWWFVALLVINTLGILEIVYLFVFAKLKFEELFSSKGSLIKR